MKKNTEFEVSSVINNDEPTPMAVEEVAPNVVRYINGPEIDLNTPSIPVEKKKAKRWPWLVAFLMLLALALGAAYYFYHYQNGSVVESTTVTQVAETVETTTAVASLEGKNGVVALGNGEWALVKDGAIREDFTGIAKNEYGKWYIKNGMVDFEKNGKVKYKDKTYIVTDGKAKLA